MATKKSVKKNTPKKAAAKKSPAKKAVVKRTEAKKKSVFAPVKKYSAAEFAKLTNTTQRIKIAEDVLAQLKAKAYAATQGTYCSIKGISLWANRGKELRDAVETKAVESCTVCALGSMFMSAIRLGDNCKVTNSVSMYNGESEEGNYIAVGGDLIHDRIHQIFGQDRRLIESAFEGADMDLEDYIDANPELELDFDQLERDCIDFYEVYPEDDERLAAIMKNIIRNEGKFIPVKRTAIVDG